MASDNEFRHFELEKLREELKQLRRPTWRTPTGITAVVAVLAVFVQYHNSERKLDLAKIQQATIQLELPRLEAKRDQVKQEIAELAAKKAQLATEEAGLREQVANLQKSASKSAPLADANQIIKSLREVNFPLRSAGTLQPTDTCRASITATITGDGILVAKATATNESAAATSFWFEVALLPLETNQPMLTLPFGPVAVPQSQHIHIPGPKILGQSIGGGFGFRQPGESSQEFKYQLNPSVLEKLFLHSQIVVKLKDA